MLLITFLVPRAGAWRRGWAAAAALAAAVFSLPAAATQAVPANLTRLIAQSEVIVSGRVKSVSDGVDAQGVPFTEVTISVGSSAKRKLAARSDFTFRQYGLLKPRKMDNGRFLLAQAPEGMPTWHEDEQVVAFLYKRASRTGLRTTVALGQGKFVAREGKLLNAHGNQGLFKGVQIKAGQLKPAESALLRSQGGPADAAALMGLVHRAVAGRWIETGVMR